MAQRGGGPRGQIVVWTSLASFYVNTGIIQFVLDIFNFPKINFPSVLVTPVLDIAKRMLQLWKMEKVAQKLAKKEVIWGMPQKQVFFLDGVFPQKPVLYYTATLLWTTFRSSHNSLSLNGTAHLPS